MTALDGEPSALILSVDGIVSLAEGSMNFDGEERVLSDGLGRG